MVSQELESKLHARRVKKLGTDLEVETLTLIVL
jgi:hypothetical protein